MIYLILMPRLNAHTLSHLVRPKVSEVFKASVISAEMST